jgi:hypothetical protein
MLIKLTRRQIYLPLPTCYDSNFQYINSKTLIYRTLIIIKKIKFLIA